MDNSNYEEEYRFHITPDSEHIKLHDELVSGYKNEKSNIKWCFLFLALTIGAFFINKIVMAVLLVITILCFVYFILMQRKKRYLNNDNFLKEIYMEGLLVPGVVINTNPLRIMAMANIIASDHAPVRNACYVLEVKRLPGMEGKLYEKIPCSCMFRYENGEYYAAFQPHPLCWGTKDMGQIRDAIHYLDNYENGAYVGEWDIIKSLSLQFPFLEPDTMLLLDDTYQPMGWKHYLADTDDYQPVLTEESAQKFPKKTPEVSYITDDIPAADLYNQVIRLAQRYNVYEYISTHCQYEDYSHLTNPGYFTYIGDSAVFSEAIRRKNITLAQGEYPLIAGSMILTNKGCWKKQAFTPWKNISISAAVVSDIEIETNVIGKCITQFKMNTEYYENKEQFSKKDKLYITQLEAQRVGLFLYDLKQMCISS